MSVPPEEPARAPPLEEHVRLLAASITDKTCTQGTRAIREEDTVLFYGKDRIATYVDIHSRASYI
jgi:hypothetical protein